MSRNRKRLSKVSKSFLRIKKILLNVVTQKLGVFLVIPLLMASFISGVLSYRAVAPKTVASTKAAEPIDLAKLQSEVIKSSYTFKVNWGDLGKKMVSDGVIDKQKLAQALTGTNNLPADLDKYLSDNQSQIELNQQNSQFWVDVLWGLGLANNNKILNSGPMAEGGNTANFASTGGYTIGSYDPMSIYAKHQYINLSDDQQREVEAIAGNIYRPCCGNSTAFPDCNHGMAALALIELMVSQNFSKDDIYKAALAFNTYWFPQTYLDTAYYFKQNGRDYSQISPQELLSKTFSSAMGYQVTQKKVGSLPWPALQSGGSCGA